MRIFKGKQFHAWAKKLRLTDEKIFRAVQEIESGLVDAALGNHLYKKRISLGSKGKSGGVRTLLAYKKGDKAFLLYGFSKNERDNIREDESNALKKLGETYLNLDESGLNEMLMSKLLFEVNYED